MKVFADTSVWINFLKGSDSKATRALQQILESGQEVFGFSLVIQEVLQGCKDESNFKKVANLLGGVTLLEYGFTNAQSASKLYRSMRKSGRTLGTIDAAIASVCIENGLSLLTSDSDFEGIPQLNLYL